MHESKTLRKDNVECNICYSIKISIIVRAYIITLEWNSIMLWALCYNNASTFCIPFISGHFLKKSHSHMPVKNWTLFSPRNIFIQFCTLECYINFYRKFLFLKCHFSPIDHKVPTSEFVTPVETLMWSTNTGQHVGKRAVAGMLHIC